MTLNKMESKIYSYNKVLCNKESGRPNAILDALLKAKIPYAYTRLLSPEYLEKEKEFNRIYFELETTSEGHELVKTIEGLLKERE